MSKNFHTRSPNIRKMHFWGTSGCSIGIICLYTPTKSTLAVILRSQPCFCDHRFTRYGFCDFFATSGLFPGYFWLTDHDRKYGTCFFWLSLSHIISFWRENESICKCTREVTQLLQYMPNLKALYLGSNLFSYRASRKNKHLRKISFSNDILILWVMSS